MKKSVFLTSAAVLALTMASTGAWAQQSGSFQASDYSVPTQEAGASRSQQAVSAPQMAPNQTAANSQSEWLPPRGATGSRAMDDIYFGH